MIQSSALKKMFSFLKLQRSLETINLDNCYESCFEPGESLQNIMAAKTDKPLHGLLSRSVYVQFLNNLKDLDIVSDDDLKKTKYFQESWGCVLKYGSYQGRIKDEIALLDYCREYLNLFKKLKVKYSAKSFWALLKDHYQFGYPDVFLIDKTRNSMIYDGAHRLACLYVLGVKLTKVKVLGVITGPIKYPQL